MRGSTPRAKESGKARRPLRRLKNSAIFHGVRALLLLLQALPLWALRGLGRALGHLAPLLARRERARALQNLQRVHPEMAPDKRQALMRAMFSAMGLSAMECLAIPRILAGDTPSVRFSEGSRTRLQRALAPRKGAIWLTAHFGNWELMAAVAAQVAPVFVLAKPSYDPRFTALIERLRASWGVRCIWVDQPGHLRRAVAALRAGAILGVLLDQPVSAGVSAPFFGHPAPTSPLIPRLAQTTQAALVEGFIYREPHAQLVEVRQLEAAAVKAKDPDALLAATAQLNRRIERAITRQPSQWAWSLARWRSSNPSALSSDR